MCFFYICLHSYYFQCFSFLLRNQRSAHFFCKRPKSLYLRLCGNWILVLPVLEWCCVAHNISRPCFLPCDGQWYLSSLAAAAAKLLQPCPTLCDPIDGLNPYHILLPDYIIFPTHQWGGNSSWGTSLLCSPFAWQSNKAVLSFLFIILSLYFCLAPVHTEPRFWQQ